MADDEILTVAQVATQFHVTPQTVRSWIDSGKLKAGRVGKAYVILRGDVFAMVEQAASERLPKTAHGEFVGARRAHFEAVDVIDHILQSAVRIGAMRRLKRLVHGRARDVVPAVRRPARRAPRNWRSGE